MSSEAMLELNQPRVIVLRDRNRNFTLTCRRITNQDWMQYFNGITVTSEQDGKERINVIDVTTPRVALAEAVLQEAEGYKVVDAIVLESLPNWQKRIPLAHRLQLGATLADARPSQAIGEFVIHPEGEEVMLDATWTSVPTEDGGFETLKYIGLKHVLRTPTEEQHRRYSRESSRSRVVGGSRTGKTVYQGAQPLLAKLYDELVVSVEGYCVDGKPLETPDQIIREMDMLHKVMAAQELFQPQSTATLAEGESE